MALRPFDPADAATVAGWAATEAEALRWCGHAGWPVPVGKVVAWSTEDGVEPFGFFSGVRLVAYGELWIDHDGAEVELARLIVDPGLRGHGYGRRLVEELAARAEYPQIFMRVHPANEAALRCYAGAGFGRVDPVLEAEWSAPQPVAYVWLTRSAR